MKTLAIVLLSAAAACGGLRTQNTPAPSGERAAVLAVVQRLFDAMRTKDSAAFRDVFDPSGRLVGMRVRPAGDTIVQILTWERFRDAAMADTRGEWIERAWSPEVQIRGTLATVWAEYDFHFGTRPSHCGVDAVQLLKTPRGWKILSIADTYEATGCPLRSPPR